jgi:hypothetical protein
MLHITQRALHLKVVAISALRGWGTELGREGIGQLREV